LNNNHIKDNSIKTFTKEAKKSKNHLENDNNNRISSINSTLCLNNNGQNRLETVLETVNEISQVDSSELSSEHENKNNINIIDANNKDILGKNISENNNHNIKDMHIYNNEQKVQLSENITSAAIATTSVNNTKISFNAFKSEKTD
jgi:transcriptional regulator with GAF, ATPase, and Fis domain